MTVILSLTVVSSFAMAEMTADSVEISASEALEWNRNKNTYTALGDVIVKQGDLQIESDQLIARYTSNRSMSDVTSLEATGNVIITNAPYVATGDKAVYNVQTGNAVMTGRKMTVTTNSDVMTVNDKIEFYSKQNKLIARGNPVIKHALQTIKARVMTAYFKRDNQGNLVADRVTATGGVKIITEKEVVTGDNAVYYTYNKQATLQGGVKVKQGENWIEGEKAHVNLVTGVSQLVSSAKAGTKKRVKGVFYPNSFQKEKEQNEGQEFESDDITQY